MLEVGNVISNCDRYNICDNVDILYSQVYYFSNVFAQVGFFLVSPISISIFLNLLSYLFLNHSQ